MFRDEGQQHVPRVFRELSTGATFRTGSSDLIVWKKVASCCATPINGGEDRKFSQGQTVYVLKGNLNGNSHHSG